MAVKLRFGDPVVIACGPTYEEVGWGPYQFPGISRLDDGRLVANFSVSDDTKEAYGSEAGRAISSDNGKTWSPISAEDLPAIKRCAGMKLPSGKRLRSCVQRPAPISDEEYVRRVSALADTLAIPEDISVAGYDGIRIGRHIEPQLTTLRQDTQAIGAKTAEKLIDLIERPKTTLTDQIVIGGEVYAGKTVGKPRKSAKNLKRKAES